MPLALGATNIDKVYLGSTEVTKAYLGATLVYSSTPAHDSDAADIIARRGTAHGTPVTPAVATAIDNAVKLMKSNGTWNACGSLVVMAGARSLTEALEPWKGPAPTSFNFVEDDLNFYTGLKGDASTKYLSANLAPDDLGQDDCHVSYFCTEPSAISSARDVIGAAGGALPAKLRLEAQFVPTVRYFFRLQSESFSSPSLIEGDDGLGFTGATRNDATTATLRADASNFSFTMNTSTPTDDTISVFRMSSESFFSDVRLSMYSLGSHVDLAALESSIESYMTEIGELP